MSPAASSAERSPLSPVEANIPLQAEPPPLELPEPLKGEVRLVQADPEELQPPELRRTDSGDGDDGSVHQQPSAASSGAILAASDAQAQEQQVHTEAPPEARSLPVEMPQKQEEQSMDVDDGAVRLSSSAPPFDPAAVQQHASLFVQVASKPIALEDEGAHGAIQALLALQRDDTPRASSLSLPFPLYGSCPEAAEPPSPTPSSQSMDSPAMRPSASKPGQQPARFFCRFPRCGKGYASTDAVRKHCRQRHLEWLRRLGHGCPALYCRWED